MLTASGRLLIRETEHQEEVPQARANLYAVRVILAIFGQIGDLTFGGSFIVSLFGGTTARVRVAGTTGLEPATSDVTGRRSNQLNYVPAAYFRIITHESSEGAPM